VNTTEFHSKELLVDDSSTIRKSAAIFLQQEGYEVALAEDGFDALAYLSEHLPDVIICDISMPRLDGYQTCAIIKSNPKFSLVPVIMLSSRDGIFDIAKGQVVGAEHYLAKPFTKNQLLEVLRTYGSSQKESSL